jgi:NADH dehydrogenase FAD-containing subunit
MENFNELYSDPVDVLEEELQELIDKADIILGYKSECLSQIAKDLLNFNTVESNILANDIMEIDADIINLREKNEYDNYETENDPFTTLYDEDSEL